MGRRRARCLANGLNRCTENCLLRREAQAYTQQLPPTRRIQAYPRLMTRNEWHDTGLGIWNTVKRIARETIARFHPDIKPHLREEFIQVNCDRGKL